MFEVIDEFVDTTVRLALQRFFPPWLRSTLAAVLMFVVAMFHQRLPDWVLALAYGHWLSLLLAVTLGTAGWLLFRAPFTRGARTEKGPWIWSGLGLATLVATLVSAEVRGLREVGFSEWYAVTAWAVAQFWYLRQRRTALRAEQVGEAFMMRALYGVPVFFFTCCMAGPVMDDHRKHIAGAALQATVFPGVMVWVNYRIQARHADR
jgi:hypothetical protein